MSAAVAALLLGVAAGILLDRAAAWTAARAAVLELEARHEEALQRLAIVQRLREAAIRRGLEEHPAEPNAWEQLRARHLAETQPRVLPLRRRHE